MCLHCPAQMLADIAVSDWLMTIRCRSSVPVLRAVVCATHSTKRSANPALRRPHSAMARRAGPKTYMGGRSTVAPALDDIRADKLQRRAAAACSAERLQPAG